MKFYLTILTALVSRFGLSAQSSSWSPYEKLYSDNYITVEISFKIVKAGCDNTENVTASKYRYKVTGQLRSYDFFLNWKMDYVDCNGNLYFRNNSLDIGRTSKNFSNTANDLVIYPDDEEFTCKSLEVSYYEVKTSDSRTFGGGLKALPLSKDPESITGEKSIYRGDQTTLTVKGGALGVGAKWVWYVSDCGGTQVGTGSSINVSPNENTTYFVRAESGKNTTNCAKVTVTVSQLSLAPSAIGGYSKICKGEAAILTVSGGRLGLDGVWVWYEGSCGGRELGRGNSISVYPENTTTYFVRAEGKFNKTDCAQSTVYVYEKSYAPVMINSSIVECANQRITLSVSGGVLAKDAQWKWYSGHCGTGYFIGTGKTVEVVPLSSSTYYVRAEGGCNNTECAKIEINPDKISSAPSYISSFEKKGNKTVLTLNGGSLGKGANWKWYKNECGKGRAIGTGTSVVVHPRKRTNYFVRAEGTCNTTNCISQYVSPYNWHKFTPVNDGSEKFLHLGIGVGLDIVSFSTKITKTEKLNSSPFTSNNSIIDQKITGFGAKGEFVFHPYMKDFFSFGVITSGAIGTTILAFAGGRNPSDASAVKEKYLYTRFDLGTEFAAGYYKLKALLIYKSSIQTHQYSADGDNGYYRSTYSFDKQLRRETVSVGIRVAPYSTERVKYKRGFCFDFLYHFSRDYSWKWDSFDWTYNAISNFQSGAGMTLWIQSILKMQIDFSMQSSLANYTLDNDKVGVQFSIIYNRNAFY